MTKVKGATARAAKPKAKANPVPVRRIRRSGNRDLALQVLGKFREVFRAAKLHFGSVHKSVGVSGAQLWALSELYEQPGLRVSELATRLSLRQSTVSNMIDQLSRAKHLKRERGDADQRVVRLYLTASGQKLVLKAPKPARGVLPDALESLAASDLRNLDFQLAALLNAMKVRAPDGSRIHLEQI